MRSDITRRSFVKTGAAALGAASVATTPLFARKAPAPFKVRFGLDVLVYTATFSKDQLDLVPKVAAMGFDGIEIPFNDLSILDAKGTKKAREKAGLGLSACAVLMPDANVTSTDAACRARGVERLKKIVDITAEMGGDTVAGPLYAPVGKLTGRGRSADEWKWACEGLRAAAEHAERSRVTLAIEPLNRFETHVINTAADATALVKVVNLPSLKVQLDTFHMNIEEKSSPAAIRATGASIGHFHASESDRGMLGTGQVRWQECFRALKEVNYDRWVTIESFATGIVELCAAACIWRPLYESADDLAKKGLAFLKELARTA